GLGLSGGPGGFGRVPGGADKVSGPRHEEVVEMSAPPLSFTGFGGLKLAAEAFGNPDNPTVVLLHGAAQTRRSWRQAAAALAAAGRYAITVDLRGHGESEWAAEGRYGLSVLAADVRAVLSQLDARPVIVGASVGGLAALAAMADGGAASASALVLVDAAPEMDPFDPATLRRQQRQEETGRNHWDPKAV